MQRDARPYGNTGSPGAFSSFNPGRLWIAAGVVCLAAVLLVFIVPLFVPMKPVQTISPSYLAGFNNTFATLAAATLSVLVFLLTLWFRWRGFALPRLAATRNERLRGGFIAAVVLASAAVLAVCAWLVTASHLRYLADAGYFIEQATVRRDTGRALYTQLEFAYGPLLLLPEIWLSQLLHCSMTAAYYVTLVLESSLGLLMLAFVLNEVPMRASLRKPAFVLLAIGAITPHLGLNYTFFRFVSPFAVLLFATRSRSVWRCALLLSVGEVFVVLISPELGLAMAVGVMTFGLLRAWGEGWRWLLTAILPIAVLGTLLLTLGVPFLHMAATFSRGALSLPVGPYPHILVFLFALVWLVPFGMARYAPLREPLGSRLLALYAISLAFLPAALGRCDPLHILFDGVGVLVLSLMGLSGSSKRSRLAWLAAIAVLVAWNHFVNERLFVSRSAEVMRQTFVPHLPKPVAATLVKVAGNYRKDLGEVLGQRPSTDFYLDEAQLNRLVGNAPVVTPIEIPLSLENQLKRTHHYDPGYYAFWVDMMNPAAEQRSIRDINACTWMLLPRVWRSDNVHTTQWLHLFQGLKLPYRTRHTAPYDAGLAFEQNLEQHWIPVQSFGQYVLYRQVNLAPVASASP